MKDWKTYAILLLAAWCAVLTYKKSRQNYVPSADIGTPADCTDIPPVWSNDLRHVEWALGGENGFMFDCYCKIMPMAPASCYSKLQRCRLTFSKDGLLVKSELLPEAVRLRADCRADRPNPRPDVIKGGVRKLLDRRESTARQGESTASKIQ